MPDANTPLRDWLAWLETLSPNAIELGLERVSVVLERLRLAQPDHVLLIGGTNGKGTSVAMADALLREAGFRVAAYTSPHIERFNERIRIDGADADDATIVAAFCAVEAARDGLPLTYFEFSTLAALVVFAQADVDVWLLEVGLGGRLDATNAVEPDASLITNVSLDHCDWLGDDVEAIAFEKAGIMRAGKPVVFAAAEIPAAIREQANSIGAQLILATHDELPESCSVDGHQRRNAAGVITLLNAAELGAATRTDVIEAVLPTIRLPGRQQLMRAADRDWLLDVAHNPAAAAVLATALQNDPRMTIALIGVLADKDVEGLVAPLCSQVTCWIVVGADSERAIPAAELARRIANHCDTACLIADDVDDGIELARRRAGERDRILVTGSFFTVGPVLGRLQRLGQR